MVMSVVSIGEFVNNYDVLTWSEDQRIALTLPRFVYIYNMVSGLRCKEGAGNDKEPLMSVNMATMPTDLESADVGVVLPDPKTEVKAPIMKRFCDQKYSKSIGNVFKMSQWTPIGCSLHGGCLLTCLMGGGHVILFAPPRSFGLQWKKIKTLSETLHDHWKETCYGDPPPCKHAFYDLDKRRELLHITTFLWLPHIIRSPETSAIILVVTTESRHVVFLRCVFNLLQGGITCSVDHMIKLPDNPWGQGCKLACMKHDDDIFLTVGCANGDVYLLLVGIAGADISYADIQPHPVIDGSDGIPVITMAWGRGFPATDHCSLVIAKNQLILVVHIPLMGGDITMHGVVEGHILPSSGLATLPSGRFISCSRDKSVVEFSSNFICGKAPKQTNTEFQIITSRQIEVDLKGEPIGVATSHNGLFVAVVELYEGVHNLAHSQCKIHFVKLISEWSDLIGCYQELVAMETPLYLCWDVFESLRQLLRIDTGQNVNTLLSAKVLKPEGNNFYCLQLARMVVAYCEHKDIGGIENFKLDGLDCHMIKNHIVTCLTSWISHSESNNNHADLVIINNMIGWLQVNGTVDDELLEKEVVTRLNSLQCTVSRQQCPVCGDQLTWQSHNSLQCSNKHSWNSCMFTCTALHDPTGNRCTQCGASAINIRSQGFQESTLVSLTERHDCILCGGSLSSL